VRSVITTALPEAAVTSESQPAATGARSPQAAPAPLANLAVLVAPDRQERAEPQVLQETAELQVPPDLLELLAMLAEVGAATVEVAPLDLQDPLVPQAPLVLLVTQVPMALQATQEPQDLLDPLETLAGLATLEAKDPQASPVLTPLRPPPVLPDLRDLPENVAQPALLAPQELKDSLAVGDQLVNVDLEETVVPMAIKEALAVLGKTVLEVMMPSIAHAVVAVECAVKPCPTRILAFCISNLETP
jgi:hypothetical protein